MPCKTSSQFCCLVDLFPYKALLTGCPLIRPAMMARAAHRKVSGFPLELPRVPWGVGSHNQSDLRISLPYYGSVLFLNEQRVVIQKEKWIASTLNSAMDLTRRRIFSGAFTVGQPAQLMLPIRSNFSCSG